MTGKPGEAPVRSQFTLLCLVLLLALAPLFLTPVAPIVDIYAHADRFLVLSDAAVTQAISDNYEPSWALLPNIGLDIPGTVIFQLFAPLTATKLLLGGVMVLQFFAVLFLAKVLWGRVASVHILLAGLILHSHILIWGFGNFLLGTALVMIGLASWLRMERWPKQQLAFATFLSAAIFLSHGFAFVIWGLLLCMVELAGARDQGRPWLVPFIGRALRLLVLAIIPAIVFVQTKTASGGQVTSSIGNLAGYAERGDLFQRLLKELWDRVDSFLRVADSTLPYLDRGLGVALWSGLLVALLTGMLKVHPRLRYALLLCLFLVPLCPPSLFSAAHLDERIPLILFLLLAASVTVTPTACKSLTTALGVFFVLRIGLTSWAWYDQGLSYQRFLDVAAQLDDPTLVVRYWDEPDGWLYQDPNCAPLEHLVMLTQGAAAPTFAYSDQQPIRMLGQMAEIQSEIATAAGTRSSSDALKILSEAGIDTIVTCGGEPMTAPAGFTIIGQDRDWTLYDSGN